MLSNYRKDTEHLYHAFMYSLVTHFFSSIYPVPAMHSLLVTSDVRNMSFTSCKSWNYSIDPYLGVLISPIKGVFMSRIKSVINYI